MNNLGVLADAELFRAGVARHQRDGLAHGRHELGREYNGGVLLD
jgi:hypothetical protein